MFKVFILSISLVLSITAIAEENQLEIQGCSFTTENYFKGGISGSSRWSQGFAVEGRQGWGLPTVKREVLSGESYVGVARLTDDGMNLEVVVTTDGDQALTVKASIKKDANGKTEVIATGFGSARATIFGPARILAEVIIFNPYISTILESDKSLRSPTDHPLFPKDTFVFSAAQVLCNAERR